MIEMYDDHESGLLCPVIMCDGCGEMITDLNGSAAVFPDRMRNGRSMINFLCRPCNVRVRDLPWRPLRQFLDQLGRNVESDLRAVPADQR